MKCIPCIAVACLLGYTSLAKALPSQIQEDLCPDPAPYAVSVAPSTEWCALDVKEKELAIVKQFLEGLDINGIRFPLLMAVADRNLPMVELLLKYEVGREQGVYRECYGKEAYWRAVAERNLPMVELLHKYGENVSEESLLWKAAASHDLLMARILIESGVNVNDPKFNPLERAVYKRDISMAELLIEKGANVTQGNFLEQAVAAHDLPMAKLLIKHGAGVNYAGGLPLLRAADYCEYGERAEKNLEKALELYAQVVDQGNADAQYNLGIMYKRIGTMYMYECIRNMYKCGENAEKNLEKAFYWFTKSAVQGNADAQYNLGIMYNLGEGTKKNLKGAFYWFTESADQGNTDAQNFLDNYYATENHYMVLSCIIYATTMLFFLLAINICFEYHCQ